jgi:hypothetical protein
MFDSGKGSTPASSSRPRHLICQPDSLEMRLLWLLLWRRLRAWTSVMMRRIKPAAAMAATMAIAMRTWVDSPPCTDVGGAVAPLSPGVEAAAMVEVV